jgi:proliferating cell nuclear antigen
LKSISYFSVAKMFEARMTQGVLLKQVIEAVKELVTQANFDVSSTGISMQAMDTSHVCLVSLDLKGDGFDQFRCDRTMSMGVNIASLSKILKCAANDDIITMKADDNGDTLTLMFESPSQDRVSDFDLKLMSIDSEHLGIPDQEYSAKVAMPSKEYQRICRDMATIGDAVVISATKDGVKFSTSGDIGTANITVRHSVTSEKEEQCTRMDITEPVALTFALRYLNNFAKATMLNDTVLMNLTKDLPIMVQFGIKTIDRDVGDVTFYLAPKIEDDDALEQEAES